MSIQGINLSFDTGPLRIERMAVHPYPDLARLWVRVQLSPFETPPNVRLACREATGNEIAEMLLVEWRDPYISLTMHLRRANPSDDYVMRVEVMRDEQIVASAEHPFQLVFQEPPDDQTALNQTN